MKYYTDQSAIPQFIPCKYSINIEKRAKQEIKNSLQWRSLNSEAKASAGGRSQNITLWLTVESNQITFSKKSKDWGMLAA